MAHRENYKPDVPSVTELLKWAGYYFGYEHYANDPTGYYLRRGNFIEQCGTILLQGRELDSRTGDLALMMRNTPQGTVAEQWSDYIDGFREWMSHHRIKFIGSQVYIYNPVHTYQGTLDWLMWVDGKLAVVDCKTGSCPPCTKLQTSAYDMGLSFFLDSFAPEVKAAVRAWGLNTPRHRIGLQLQPGKCTPHEYDPKDYHRHNGDFRLLVSNWWKHGPQSKEYK